MIEDFSYTAELVSKCDGLKIGAQGWWDLDYDAAASLLAIKDRGVVCCVPDDVKPIADNENLFVYPNPVKSVLNVKNAKNADITITNMDGRVVRNARKVSSVSVSDLANGMYSVIIKEGNRISMQKVLINRN